MKKVDVLMIVPSFPNISETFIFNKLLSLINNNTNVYLYCDIFQKKTAGQFKSFASIANFIISNNLNKNKLIAPFYFAYAIFWVSTSSPKKLWQYFYFGYFKFGINPLKNFLTDWKILWANPKILHFEFGTTAAHRYYLKDIIGAKIVVSFRGFDLNLSTISQKSLYDNLWNGVDHVHFLSNDLQLKARNLGMPNSLPQIIIAPAIDTDFFNPTFKKPKHTQQLMITSVGRLDWRKGYEIALQALAQFRNNCSNFIYTIIGEGPCFEALIFESHQLGLEKNINFAGKMNSTQIRNTLNDSDIFLHTAVSEGFCNAVLEAQAMGLPVISSDAGGLKENVSHGETGLMFKSRDVKSAARHLSTLWKSPDKRKLLGDNGINRVRNHFNLNQQALKFREIYVGL